MISYIAIAGSGFVNCFLMRSKEMQEGISVHDQHGNDVGKSKIVAKKAVVQTAATRMVLPIFPLLFPTVTFYLLEKRSMIPKQKGLKLLLESVVLFASMMYSVPIAVSLFPQNCSTSVDVLEPEFHNLKDDAGNKISTLYYNKGL